ncbi:3221_t:CDS:1, partial [Entrophospora sp. SA101]
IPLVKRSQKYLFINTDFKVLEGDCSTIIRVNNALKLNPNKETQTEK